MAERIQTAAGAVFAPFVLHQTLAWIDRAPFRNASLDRSDCVEQFSG
jgi:hypothetical protein